MACELNPIRNEGGKEEEEEKGCRWPRGRSSPWWAGGKLDPGHSWQRQYLSNNL